MQFNRDFKGVWIPKEIWLNNDLSMLEKVLLTEIDSLDNENHCTAGNEYFAEFCNCSQSAITKALKHLRESGFIEDVEFDGRHRKMRIVKFTMQPSKFYEAESENLRANNIDNNTDNKKNSGEFLDTTDRKTSSKSFELKQKKLVKKPNLYHSCTAVIDSLQTSERIRAKLVDYLDFRLEVKDRPLFINQWKGMVNKLRDFPESDWEAIIQQSIDRGYLAFYSLKSNNSRRKSEPKAGTGCQQMTKEEEEKQSAFIRQLQREGKRTQF